MKVELREVGLPNLGIPAEMLQGLFQTTRRRVRPYTCHSARLDGRLTTREKITRVLGLPSHVGRQALGSRNDPVGGMENTCRRRTEGGVGAA